MMTLDNSIRLNENAMLKVRPELFDEWNFEKNKDIGIDIYKTHYNNTKKVWWTCLKCNSEYDLSIYNRAKINQNCPFCSGKRINHTNSLATLNPSLAKEWHPTKNGELTPHMVACNYSKKVWWVCLECSSEYFSSANSKLSANKSGCPYCSGKLINHTNSLASKRQDLASQWHPTKNGDLTPHGVTVKNNQKVWWLGKCGHEWDAQICHRTRTNKSGCPYCSSHKLLKGFNDIWTTNPKLASMLADPEDGYKYMQSSNKKVDWRCADCGSTIKNKSINNISNRRLPCSNCSDGRSLPEKIMSLILSHIVESYHYELSFEWSNNKRYDFYLPHYDIIIEMHGSQHYEQSKRKEARTLKEEQENDRLKYETAMKNNIKEYIIIECKRSDFKYIRNSILNSRMAELFDLSKVDWSDIKIKSFKSTIKTYAEMWNDGLTVKEIVEKVDLGWTSVTNYLKIGSEIGMCNYTPRESRIRSIAYHKSLSENV